MSTELPDFNTAMAWMDRHGQIHTDIDLDPDMEPWLMHQRLAPWEPLLTADEWAKQRDGIAEAAAKLSESMSIGPTGALRIVTEATDHIGTRKLTADEWGKRIDRDKLAEILKPYFSGGDVAYGEHVECADAVLAALPELMGGAA